MGKTGQKCFSTPVPGSSTENQRDYGRRFSLNVQPVLLFFHNSTVITTTTAIY